MNKARAASSSPKATRTSFDVSLAKAHHEMPKGDNTKQSFGIGFRDFAFRDFVMKLVAATKAKVIPLVNPGNPANPCRSGKT
jgi:hypothetical protein